MDTGIASIWWPWQFCQIHDPNALPRGIVTAWLLVHATTTYEAAEYKSPVTRSADYNFSAKRLNIPLAMESI